MDWDLNMLVFEEKGKTGVPAEKCLEDEKRPSNSLSCLIVEASEHQRNLLSNVASLTYKGWLVFFFFYINKQEVKLNASVINCTPTL